MSDQERAAWLNQTEADIQAHLAQFDAPYRCPLAFAEWLEARGCFEGEGRVADLCTATGANAYLLAKRYPHLKVTGFDLHPEQIALGRKELERRGQSNCELVVGDLFELAAERRGAFDGLTFQMTLFVLSDYVKTLEALAALEPSWIALTTPLFPGKVDFEVRLKDYTRSFKGLPYEPQYYNLTSTFRLSEVLEGLGYQVELEPWEIDLDLPQPSHGSMGTYTERTADGRRLQISGSLLMNWHFVLARKAPA